MKIRAVLATALMLLPSTGVKADEAEYKKVFDGIYAAGATVNLVNNCPPKIEGAYYRSKGALFLCTNNTKGNALFRVLTHEAVHVVQDCIVGRVGDGHAQAIGLVIYDKGGSKLAENFAYNVIAPLLSENTINHVRSSEPKEKWAMELEAYALQNDPKTVISLLNLCR
jgi:hypothetical protein